MKIGILGAGQLAQLLCHSAYALGIETLCFAEQNNMPAARLSPIFIGNLDDKEALQDFASQCDVITLENENIDVAILEFLAAYCQICPCPEAIRISQDRLLEKNFLRSLDIKTPNYVAINSLNDLIHGIEQIGLPAVLKTRRFGYDGKGQAIIKDKHDVYSAWEAIKSAPAILEQFIAFDFEVSLIAARNHDGEEVFYFLNKNTHQDGILRIAENPYQDKHLQSLAEYYTSALFKKLNYIGVLGFEFFVQSNQLIANELAPRVHNSGHATIEGYNSSQFESHLRSIMNWPLIQPTLRTPTLMYNLIGNLPKLSKDDYQAIHFYNYGKEERPGRKVGHLTFMQPDQKLLDKLLRQST